MSSTRKLHRVLPFALAFLALGPGGCTDAPTAAGPDIAPLGAAHVSARPLRLEFWKCFDETAGGLAWAGAVSGDLDGALSTRIDEDDLRFSGQVMHFRSTWRVTGDRSFVAELEGSLNNHTGRSVLNGPVSEGYLADGRVHVEGALTDAANSCFEGTMRIMRATGD
jgi:hypothetical protein